MASQLRVVTQSGINSQGEVSPARRSFKLLPLGYGWI